MNVKIILNPYANRWQAQAEQAAVERACQAAGLDYDLVVTPGPGEAIALAEAAAISGQYDAVAAAGGDGTINEVVNGLLRAAGDEPTMPFGIIPLGTANDFVRMAGLPLSISGSVQVIAGSHVRPIDGGKVNDRYFINNSAAAMEPMVTIENIRMTWLSGEIRYIAALVRALAKLKPWTMSMTWNGGSYEGPVYLLSVCNSPRTGGFMMAPGALIDDGWFDVVFAPQVPRATVLAVLARLMRGTHVDHPTVSFTRITHLHLTSSPGTPLHADGEVFDEAAEEVDYRILPGRVSLLSPATGPE